MNSKENMKSLKERLKGSSFKLFYKSELFDTFEYDEELDRYQSSIGFLTIKKVFEINKGLEKDLKIVWGE